ncbi:uncharacterized [Tachysurus ichikawai]
MRTHGPAHLCPARKRVPCHLTDEDTHACGQLAHVQRVTGRGAGSSSSLASTGDVSAESEGGRESEVKREMRMERPLI